MAGHHGPEHAVEHIKTEVKAKIKTLWKEHLWLSVLIFCYFIFIRFSESILEKHHYGPMCSLGFHFLLCHQQIQETVSIWYTSSLQCSIYETALGSRYITSNIFALRKKDCRNWNNLATCVLQFFSK